ncbi:MAG: hypothetical protein I3273_06460 [Candidatus Moeniiplasma glomeromycotorum]|nr:hypothetical protein [Candidatus Moeniiplasma glomeromycotorum]MCE8167942.1 hypothetical protein [Candidatus Moeniiplasma glomeromycotorum]MCE8169727.1 hypothetical protein [Candidatus Moeniiplasma glomeromycotorum]
MLELKLKKWLKISLLFLLSLYILNFLGLIVHEIGGHALTQKIVGGSVEYSECKIVWVYQGRNYLKIRYISFKGLCSLF